MLVVMQQGATEPQIEAVIDRLVELGLRRPPLHRRDPHGARRRGRQATISTSPSFEVMEGVKEAHRIVSPYKLASRSFRPGGTVVKIGDVEIGGERMVVMAGPVQRGEPRPDRALRRDRGAMPAPR